MWHVKLIERLKAERHDLRISFGRRDHTPLFLEAVLLAERLAFPRKVPQLFRRQKIERLSGPDKKPDLTIDLSERGLGGHPEARLTLMATGSSSPVAEWAATIAGGGLPRITLDLDGTPVAQASPMIENRISIGWALENVLARAICLIVKTVRQILAGRSQTPVIDQGGHGRQAFLPAYLRSTIPRSWAEALRRIRYRYAHWRVGYRFIEGEGVAEKLSLSGTPWQVLPDDETRFYADPFPFLWKGKYYIFVEDYVHAQGKAIISVSCLDNDGRANTPVSVIEEPHHLSYPQIFEMDGEVWMLPEASAGRELVLYRAEDFPFRWVRHTVLFSDRVISDATLIEQAGTFWLLATDATSGGSASDSLVAYSAPRLAGPWTQHGDNPIKIDHRGARPGGAAVRHNGRLLLPVQDGTNGYGGGLGVSDVAELSDCAVHLTPPQPIQTEGFWPYPQIHTLNRHGSLEVIDGIARVRKPLWSRR